MSGIFSNGDEEPEGWTEYTEDFSRTVGVECRACGWAYDGPAWREQLHVTELTT